MSSNGSRKYSIHENPELCQRPSLLYSSKPSRKSLPIDFVLVYTNKTTDNDQQPNNDGHPIMSIAEQRYKFEHYLTSKQGLILEHAKASTGQTEYVKVHAPFDALLLMAENSRMKLPFEEIKKNKTHHSRLRESYWCRFMNSIKKQFLLDSSISQDDIDYYKAVYSPDIEQFRTLFDKLRGGSRDFYFTPGERSLLTYELLSKEHFDHIEGNVHVQGSIARPEALDTIRALESNLQRPGLDRLIARRVYDTYFPLHESKALRNNVTDANNRDLGDREKLKKYWATMRQFLKFQPLLLVRSYMGEKIAFYFAFIGFYNQTLILPSIVGIIIFIYGAATVATDQPTSDICGNFGNTTYMCPRCDKECPFWRLSDSCIYSNASYVFDNAATLVFAIFMSIWGRLFVKLWKRHQAVLQYDWVDNKFELNEILMSFLIITKDSIDFQEHFEPIRPKFEKEALKKGRKTNNPVTNEIESSIPIRKRVPFFLITTIVVLFTISISCTTLFAIIVYRVQMGFILNNTSVQAYSSIIITVTSAIMNLICSIALSLLYYWVAQKLTDLDLECHKYQSKYDDSLTVKIYIFQFVNYYSSLFYIAYFKGRFFEYPSKYGEPNSTGFQEQCDPAGCFVDLSIQFVVIMTGQQIVIGIVEFFMAMFGTIKRACCSRDDSTLEQWEKDRNLYDLNSIVLIDEYLKLVIQFGFVTLFVAAFPLAPLCALINNLIELRLDAWKLLTKYKRPLPFKASDIGIWNDIIAAVSHLAVLTNAAIIAWTSEFIPKMSYRTLQSTGISLVGYVNWTLSYFPISDYNATGLMPSDVPSDLAYCRYRDFRESIGPYYSHTTVYWNVTAARLAFILVFQQLVSFITYLIECLTSDVPKHIKKKIAHERYIEEHARWTSKKTEENFRNVVRISRDIPDNMQRKYGNSEYSDEMASPRDINLSATDISSNGFVEFSIL
ncbi:unnamed protein product [Rotaria socialis]|uniref:Anoctamin n=2 Tax=Rotaria socialis TaxID=392032 RepID=A0A818FQ86_9BILA|nr:unnamed protein product [Rotaria socialis]